MLHSYVVDHDHGFAPNPSGKYCTLVHCKFSKGGRKNIVEKASVGDWVMGTGGQSSHSVGNGRIVYLMRVDEKLPFDRYMRDTRFAGRIDHCDEGQGNEFSLVSQHYFYFGRNAIEISDLPPRLRGAALAKRGPGFRSDLPEHLVTELVSWFERSFEIGMHGDPCSPLSAGHIEAIRLRSIPGAGSLCTPPQAPRARTRVKCRPIPTCENGCA